MNEIIVGILILIGLGILVAVFSRKRVKDEPFVLTEEFKHALTLLNDSTRSVFITGKAGTGKSTLIQHFLKSTNKKCVVVAPTGVAALNIGGSTIHSFFRFPPKIMTAGMIKPDYERAGLFQAIEIMIIDEVSMVRADLMNAIDIALRKNRNKDIPFGGMQMVFVGDLFQLPPVVTDEDRDIIMNRFGGKFFFDAPVFGDFPYEFLELTKIFRQDESQEEFKNVLNKIRVNQAGYEEMVVLNKRTTKNTPPHNESLFLTTRRDMARDINRDELNKLSGQEVVIDGTLTGEYVEMAEKDLADLERKLPAPIELHLKVGAQAMTVRNDPGKKYVNGSIGVITSIIDDAIAIKIEDQSITIDRFTWSEMDYELDERGMIVSKVKSSFTQFPLVLAYAMTIHKSQGKSFECVTVDVGSGAFAPGQVYVALSRSRSLEGLVLNNKIKDEDIFVDPRVAEYYETRTIPASTHHPEKEHSAAEVLEIIEQAVQLDGQISIIYVNANGEASERLLSTIRFNDEYGRGNPKSHIKAYCHNREADRTFSLVRIRKVELLA